MISKLMLFHPQIKFNQLNMDERNFSPALLQILKIFLFFFSNILMIKQCLNRNSGFDLGMESTLKSFIGLKEEFSTNFFRAVFE
jgi:hypothetical protein